MFLYDMPMISDEKIEKISEQILLCLFSVFPRQIFTVDVARELARDEEFIKRLLLDLEKKGLVLRIDRSSKGIRYARRMRWRISNKAYDVYKRAQE